jgi:hypothetical protein
MRRREAANRDSPVRSLGEAEIVSADGALQGGAVSARSSSTKTGYTILPPPNDRLLLGMKGTMSEMELSVFRQRSIEAMKQKARRGV